MGAGAADMSGVSVERIMRDLDYIKLEDKYGSKPQTGNMKA